MKNRRTGVPLHEMIPGGGDQSLQHKNKKDSALSADTRQLAAITDLAVRQLHLEAEVAKVEALLAEKRRQLNHVRCELLPEALEEAGLAEIKLLGGHVVRLGTDYTCSLTGQYRGPALAWLRKEGLGDIVSHNVTEVFGPGDAKQLEKLRRLLLESGVAFVEAEIINTNTFKALVRERLEAGEPVPLAEIGVTAVRATKIEAPKARRKR